MKRLLPLLFVVAAACDINDPQKPSVGPRAPEPAKPAAAPFKVKFETSRGNFVVQVTPEWAPIGAEHFRELVKDGFYDGACFFRVIKGFMAQFGLAADPAQTAKWKKTLIDDPVRKSNTKGRITYAKTNAPNSRSTQLFINYGDNARLDTMGFSPFGEVIEGMEIVEAITDEYGEKPDQGQITSKGNGYLDDKFPNLDRINSAKIIE